MDVPDALLAIALDLTASLASQDRLLRLLEAVRRSLPCDAVAVLELAGDDLVPLATHGLAPEHAHDTPGGARVFQKTAAAAAGHSEVIGCRSAQIFTTAADCRPCA